MNNLPGQLILVASALVAFVLLFELWRRWRERPLVILVGGLLPASVLLGGLWLAAAPAVEGSPLAAFFVRLALVGLTLTLLAKGLAIWPRRPLVALMLVPAALSVALLTWPAGLRWLGILDLVVVGLAYFDLLSLPRREHLAVERQVGRIASLSQEHACGLWVENRGSRSLLVDLRDDLDEDLDPLPVQFSLRLPPRSRANLACRLRPRRRGLFRLAEVSLRLVSRGRCWQRLIQYPCPGEIHVYPDLKQLGEYSLLARTNRLGLLGVRRTRRVGQDHEFERLRDYTPDDNYKHIDWRTTARRGKLTVRDFQATQSQRLVFLLDCGRMMTNQARGLSLLDHGLNSLLMLAYVALAQGDSVGLLCFSDEIHSYVPPSGGRQQMNRLLHASFDRFPKLVESRYDLAFLHLAARLRKRSLVVLVTHVIDDVNANQVGTWLAAQTGRHLPLGVFLRDRRLFELGQPSAEADLYTVAAAAEIIAWRQQVLTRLTRDGVLALDVFPDEMTAPLINRYLQIKARHLL